MTLSELQALVLHNRRKILVVAIVLGVGVVGLAAVLSRRTTPGPPGPQPTVQFPEGSQPAPINIDLSKITILTPEIPGELPDYKVSQSQTTLSESEVLAFSQALGFGKTWTSKDSVDTGDRYIFAKGGEFLTVPTSPPSVFFSTGSLLPKGEVPSEEQAVAAGKSLLSKLGLEDLIPLPGSYRLLVVDSANFFVTNNFPSANLISLTFASEKSGLPIIGNTPADLSATIFLDTTKTVTSLQYYKVTLQFESRGVMKIKPLDTALTELKDGGGTVVGAQPFEELDIDANPNVLNSFSPTTVYLAYYLSGDGSLTPVYVFEGTGVMGSGKGEVIATVYLSASTE